MVIAMSRSCHSLSRQPLQLVVVVYSVQQHTDTAPHSAGYIKLDNAIAFTTPNHILLPCACMIAHRNRPCCVLYEYIP